MFQTKAVEKIKTHVLCSVTFFENRSIYEKMWKDIVERGRPQMTIWRIRFTFWVPKATHAHTQVVQYSFLFHCNMVARTRHKITLHVHCLSCLILYFNYSFILHFCNEMLKITIFNFFPGLHD